MIKCFWCGCMNAKGSSACCNCKRDMQWSNFFRGLLRPSVGCLLGGPAPVVEAVGARAPSS